MGRKKSTTGTQLARRGDRKVAPPAKVPKQLVADLRKLIDESRQAVAQTVNTALVRLYWNIGRRIREDILKQKRAEYGEQIVSSLSRQLTTDYGRGFGVRNLFNMIRFAEVFPDAEIVHALSAQLSWTHFRTIISLDDPLKRDFYAEMCRVERWSTRTLQNKIAGMLFERTALSKKPEELARQELAALRDEDRLTPDLVFRDPYFLDFLGLKDTYAEKDLEAAILRELEAFILELGVGFTFAARQKRITIDGRDYYLDLLFYHRGLRRLVAVDLKLGAFEAADKGQMELYLRWLERSKIFLSPVRLFGPLHTRRVEHNPATPAPCPRYNDDRPPARTAHAPPDEIMPHQISVDRHSTGADFELLVAGRSYSVAQVAPDFLLLDTPAQIPPGPGTLIIRAEGRERRRDIELPERASQSSRRVRILRR